MLAKTVQDYTDNVQQRYQHRGEGDHQVGIRPIRERAVRHAQVDDQEAEHVAQRQAAGVAHEKLMPTVRAAEDVVTPKGHQDTQRAERKQGVNVLPLDQKDHAQDRQGDATQTRGQTVDTVNQVDGVRHVDHGEDRDRNAQQGRDGIDPEQATQRVEPVAGQHQQKGRHDLHDELVTVTHTHQVVADTHQVKQRHPHEQEKILVQHAKRETPQVRGPQAKAKAHQQGHRHQDNRKERQSAQTGDRGRMHLAGVRDIIQAFLVRDHQDPRDDDHA